MEEFSVQPLSEGLGFYEKNWAFDGEEATEKKRFIQGNRSVLGQKPPSWFPQIPEKFLLEKWDPQKKGAYDDLLALLEKPFLQGQGQGAGSKVLPSLRQDVGPDTSHQVPLNQTGVPQENLAKPKKGSLPLIRNSHKDPALSWEVAKGGLESQKKKALLFPAGALAFRKTLCVLGGASLIDMLLAGLFFFPPFLFFMFLTETLSLSVFSLLWPKILLAFLIFVQIYYLVCRLFCFETFGEALIKVRLAPLKSKGMVHPLSLFGRFLISCWTGFVLLPLLSWIFKKDMMGHITGLHFQKT